MFFSYAAHTLANTLWSERALRARIGCGPVKSIEAVSRIFNRRSFQDGSTIVYFHVSILGHSILKVECLIKPQQFYNFLPKYKSLVYKTEYQFVSVTGRYVIDQSPENLNHNKPQVAVL